MSIFDRQQRAREIEIIQNSKYLKSSSIFGEADNLPNQPYLLVDHVGLLQLPLSQTQAQQLMKVCSQASYSFNKARIIDTNVRDSFELSPSNFEISYPDWQNKVNFLAQKAVLDMTRGRTASVKITAKLHKMLIYKTNGHFSRHRDDSSKDMHMFGTLVIQLPSDYTGGDFITYYGNEEQTYDFGRSLGKSKYGVHFTAHFADIEHESKPITSGYRLILIYILCCNDTQFNIGKYRIPMPLIGD